MADPYTTLGVSKTASDDEIRSAYRKLAKKYHPDLNPGNKEAEDRFKEIQIAHDILGDPEKRRQYDAGEIDETGAETPKYQYYRDFADGPQGAKYYTSSGFGGAEGFAADDLEDFLRQAFGGAGGFRAGAGFGDQETRSRQQFKMRGQDVSYTLRVSFLDAAKGAKKSVTMPDGKRLNVTVPEGTEDRQTLRLKGQGGAGVGGGPDGDAYIEVHIEPHAWFSRKDNNVHVDVPITLKEAVLGGKIEVPTIHGPVSMSVPKGANTGTTLRLKEKGIKDRKTGQVGHQFVHLKVMLPEKADEELEQFARDWTPKDAANPREEML